jgi:hypothetical protein
VQNIPIPTPFTHIAAHVIQNKLVGQLSFNGGNSVPLLANRQGLFLTLP